MIYISCLSTMSWDNHHVRVGQVWLSVYHCQEWTGPNKVAYEVKILTVRREMLRVFNWQPRSAKFTDSREVCWHYIFSDNWKIFENLRQTHEFEIRATRQRARAGNSTICYRKKQIDVSFSCVCPVIDNEFRHHIVKVVCGSTRLSPRGSTATLTMWWRN